MQPPPPQRNVPFARRLWLLFTSLLMVVATLSCVVVGVFGALPGAILTARAIGFAIPVWLVRLSDWAHASQLQAMGVIVVVGFVWTIDRSFFDSRLRRKLIGR